MTKKIDESRYIFGGVSDEVGGPKPNEDYFIFKVLDADTLFIAVADGMGSKPSTLQPAAIVCVKAAETIERLFKANSEVFLENPDMMLTEAVHVANNVVGAFKISNEEQHAGFAASMVCVLICGGDKFCFSHVGNCRINLIRTQEDGSSKILQVTIDHTQAMELLSGGIITQDEFNTHPDRFVLKSSIGVINDPDIQQYKGKLKKNDILLITTDGVHYNIRPEPMAQIVLQANNWEDATAGLIQGARLEKAGDNATAVLFINSNRQ